MQMRALAILSIVLVTACSSTGSDDNTTPDAGGATPDGGEATTDGGDTTPDGGHDGPETCTEEGATQDCQGITDGNCTAGTRECFEGVWSACFGRTQPVPGMCDVPSCAGGPNEGCGCLVGTFRRCYDGNQDTLGVTCRQGYQECVAKAGGSEWGPCKNQLMPQDDDCSGRDLDCVRGDPEAGCSCTNGDTRDCGGVSGGTCALGTQTCTGGKWGACSGETQPVAGDCTVPSCLGENVPNPGCACVAGATEPCYTGIFGSDTAEGSTCAAGTRTCTELGEWGACLGQTRPLPTCDVTSCSGTALAACE